MTKIIQRQCAMSGCKFLVSEDDPVICKCAAEVHGLRPERTKREHQFDAMLSLPEFERGLLTVAIQRLNEREAI